MIALRDCGDCGNRRHVFSPERGWEPCDCVKRAKIAKARQTAGLAGILASEDWARCADRYRFLPARGFVDLALAARAGKPQDMVLHGAYRGVEVTFALILGDVIERGVAVRVTDARALVDQAFARDTDAPDPAKEPVLGLRLGSEPQHSWTAGLVERLLIARAGQGLPTIVAAAREPSVLLGMYGRAPGIDGTLGRFPSVRVDQKEGRGG